MTKESLIQALQSLGICRDAYSLDGDSVDEAYVLEAERDDWVVYYSERGLRSGLQRFKRESDACEYLYERLARDANARAGG